MGGFWVRTANLSQPSFDIDEYLHVFSAQALNATGSPLLPSDQAYTRALPYTWIVAQGFRWFGVSELTARLPRVLIDLLGLAMVYLIARTWFDRSTALLAVGILAFAPWWIMDAKNCRMYTLFHCAYLTSAWASWRALEGPPGRRWMWVGIAVAAAGLALSVHALAATLVVAIGLFILGQALFTREKRYVALTILGVFAVSIAAGTRLVNLGDVWERVNYAPAWAQGTRYDWGYYLRQWWDMYPFFLLFYPLTMVRLWRRQRTVAWFLVCIGVVAFGLHSFLFDWKRLRYALYLLPWLVLPVAAGAVVWFRALLSKRAAWSIGVAIIVAVMAVHPWLWQAGTVAERFPAPPWRANYAKLQAQLQPNDAVLTSMPLATLYYLGHPATYVMNNVHIKDAIESSVRASDGFRVDGYAGLPMVTTLNELQHVVSRHERGWILIDRLRFQGKTTVTAPVRDYIQTSMERITFEQEEQAQNPVIIYRWDRTTEGSASAARMNRGT
jgi:hypothetical protein